MNNPPLVRILVADQSEARFYSALGARSRPKLLRVLRNPIAHLHQRALDADRPGQTLARAISGGRNHGSGARHAVGGERNTKRHAVKQFARRVAAELEREHRAKRFDRLALVAGPAFLGALRAQLSPRVEACVSAAIHKDVVHRPDWDVRSHLADEIFSGPVGFERTRATTHYSRARP